MPIYEYICGKCGSCFSFLKLKQSDEPVCPKCGSHEVSKIMSACSLGGSSSGGGGTFGSAAGGSGGC